MYSYDLGTPVGLIRLNTFQQLDKPDPLFQDEELTALYLQEQSTIKLAAARVLEIVATREAWIQKVIKLLSLTTDGTKLAAEFRAQAAALRAQAASEVSTGDDGATFDIAEQIFDNFTLREYVGKRY